MSRLGFCPPEPPPRDYYTRDTRTELAVEPADTSPTDTIRAAVGKPRAEMATVEFDGELKL